jgi:hypothetical protein
MCGVGWCVYVYVVCLAFWRGIIVIGHRAFGPSPRARKPKNEWGKKFILILIRRGFFFPITRSYPGHPVQANMRKKQNVSTPLVFSSPPTISTTKKMNKNNEQTTPLSLVVSARDATLQNTPTHRHPAHRDKAAHAPSHDRPEVHGLPEMLGVAPVENEVSHDDWRRDLTFCGAATHVFRRSSSHPVYPPPLLAWLVCLARDVAVHRQVRCCKLQQRPQLLRSCQYCRRSSRCSIASWVASWDKPVLQRPLSAWHPACACACAPAPR